MESISRIRPFVAAAGTLARAGRPWGRAIAATIVEGLGGEIEMEQLLASDGAPD
jgi:hypothetical protein